MWVGEEREGGEVKRFRDTSIPGNQPRDRRGGRESQQFRVDASDESTRFGGRVRDGVWDSVERAYVGVHGALPASNRLLCILTSSSTLRLSACK